MKFRFSAATLSVLIAFQPASTRAEDPQEIYFTQLTSLCGKAFLGAVKKDTADSATYRGKQVILHIRDCSDTQIKMPMHVGDNSSRILILTKTADGIQLQHDHRHHDGTSDDLTLYGGTTKTKGTVNQQNFPVNAVTHKMFVDADIERSLPNVWSIKVFPGKTAMYKLKRPTLDFQIEFDLTKEVKNPPKAWDLVKH
jgi:hypothetical protein